MCVCVDPANINANHLLMRNQQNTKKSNISLSKATGGIQLLRFFVVVLACRSVSTLSVRVCAVILLPTSSMFTIITVLFFPSAWLVFLSFYILIVKLLGHHPNHRQPQNYMFLSLLNLPGVVRV